MTGLCTLHVSFAELIFFQKCRTPLQSLPALLCVVPPTHPLFLFSFAKWAILRLLRPAAHYSAIPPGRMLFFNGEPVNIPRKISEYDNVARLAPLAAYSGKSPRDLASAHQCQST